MDTSDEELPVKTPKMGDSSKCVQCKVYFRKGTVKKAKEFKQREEAENFTLAYGFFVQVDDSICDKCYTKLRVQRSKRQAKQMCLTAGPELLDQEIPSTSKAVTKSAVTLVEALSQSSLEDTEDSDNTLNVEESQHLEYYPPIFDETPSSSQVESQGSDYCPPVLIEIEFIIMPFPRVVITKSYCFICNSKTDLRDVPFDARIQVFLKRRLFIPRRNRCCSSHMIKNRFFNDEIEKMVEYSNESAIDADEVKQFIAKLGDEVDARLHDRIRSISLSEERIKAFTGHNGDTIILVRDMMQTMRDSHNRNVLQALVIFLFKLKSGNSDKLIAAIMDITEEVVRDSIQSVLKCFRDYVLPTYFGVEAHTRDFF
ncbi:hypothetical protein R5R35_007537 [Gryllus longicercus]|uniref:Uncharacterized protein n=1 Tax=Gryllus longicercus TaxID=2509291 RepID=A0AAN9WGL8_9ORTH